MLLMTNAPQEIENETEAEIEEQEGELTVIHFVTKPNLKYDFNWWVCVLPQMYIRPCGSEEKYSLVFAFNIPVSPNKHYFSDPHEHLHFTLFFHALPKGTTHIDIVELDGAGSVTYLNFYNVPMSKVANGIIMK